MHFFAEPLFALLAPSASALTRMQRGMFDDTFAGIHQLAWFDWALLIPYFGILAILSVYGLHRFLTDPYLFQASRESRVGVAHAF